MSAVEELTRFRSGRREQPMLRGAMSLDYSAGYLGSRSAIHTPLVAACGAHAAPAAQPTSRADAGFPGLGSCYTGEEHRAGRDPLSPEGRFVAA